MDPFRGLGLPRIPGLSELVDVLREQTEADFSLDDIAATVDLVLASVRSLPVAACMPWPSAGPSLQRWCCST